MCAPSALKTLHTVTTIPTSGPFRARHLLVALALPWVCGVAAPSKTSAMSVHSHRINKRGVATLVVASASGATAHMRLRLWNPGPAGQRLELAGVDASGQGGDLTYNLPDASKHGVAAWIRLAHRVITLSPGSRTLTFEVRVPRHVLAGTYAGALTAFAVPPPGDSQPAGITVRTRIAYPISVKVTRKTVSASSSSQTSFNVARARRQVVPLAGGCSTSTSSLNVSGATPGSVSVSLNGSDQTVYASLASYNASNTTCSGWHLQFQATQFRNTNGDTFATGSLSMAPPAVSACISGCGTKGTGNPPSICIHATTVSLDTGAAVTVASAATNNGDGQYTFTPGALGTGNLALAIPSYAYATPYSSTLTVTLVQGPAASC